MTPRTLALGVFDGVHLGHRGLISNTAKLAAQNGTEASIMTFSPHPMAVIAPGREPRLLSSITEREKLILEAGADEVIVEPFTPELRKLTAAQFLAFLREKYNVRHLVTGFNHSFGSDRISDPDEYKRLASRQGITVSSADEVLLPDLDRPLCSSSIRQYLYDGYPEKAAMMLGRLYSISGTVEKGRGVGHKFGFPTANMRPHCAEQLVPADGVYACLATVRGATHGAVVNIGTRPTFGLSDLRTIEAHIFGINGDLYDLPFTIEFISRQRGECRFDSVESLGKQIEKDKLLAKTIIKPYL